MKYKIIARNSEALAVEGVAEAIADGWKPLGGVALTYSPDVRKYLFAQAMVKIDDKITWQIEQENAR